MDRILSFQSIGSNDPVEYVDGWESALENALMEAEKHEEIT